MEHLMQKYNGDIGTYKRVKRNLFQTCPNIYIDLEDIMMFGYESEKVFDYNWYNANTPKKRKKLLNEVSSLPSNYYECEFMKKYPECYILAVCEDEIEEILHDNAIIIQKNVRGLITRNKCGVYNPNTDIGKQFLKNMFDYWKNKET